MRPKVGRPVAKARAISGLLMKTTAGEAVGEQHLETTFLDMSNDQYLVTRYMWCNNVIIHMV